MHLATCVELLHNASLIHDDVQDSELQRRGRDTLWTKYGTGTAICIGDELISRAFYHAALLEKSARVPALIRAVHEHINQTITGQTQDLTLAPDTIDEAVYAQIAVRSLPFIASGAHDAALEQVGLCTGDFALAYQILDDIEDQVEDAARGGGMNLIAILARTHGDAAATELARARACDLLHRARRNALELPAGSGTLLANCCERMLRETEARIHV